MIIKYLINAKKKERKKWAPNELPKYCPKEMNFYLPKGTKKSRPHFFQTTSKINLGLYLFNRVNVNKYDYQVSRVCCLFVLLLFALVQ
jgi:hypothetical protein